MKKMIMALAFFAVTIANMAFAGTGGGIDGRIKKAFEKEYAGAADVQWYTFDNYVKVDFSFEGLHLMAFYNNNGDMIGLARNISFSSLPILLQLEQRKHYSNYWITSIYELVNGEGSRYYLTLENADNIIKLGSNGTANWELVKKQDKK
jgi:hypothetical protein